MSNNQDSNNYESRDFYLSGFLMATGVQLKDWYKTGMTTTFIFNQDDGVDELIQDYYAMKAHVNPVTYGQSLKNLKSIIHSNSNTQPNYNNGAYKSPQTRNI